jgi:glycosyltransferase involved in cell wall biosynthesis
MSCGCACVSVKTCAIPDYIEHEENGFLVSSPEEARYYLEILLKNKKLRQKLGKAARATIEAKCNKDVFTKNWNSFIQRIV